MDVLNIIGKIEAADVTLSLAIDYEGSITPEVEELLRELSNDREAAIDALAGRRFVPLPDDIKLPAQFRSDYEKRTAAIFRTCFDMLIKFEGITELEEWKEASVYYQGKLSDKDPLAVSMFTICYEETHTRIH